MKLAETMQDFETRLKHCAEQVETGLGELINQPALPTEITRPSLLVDAMRYAALNGGKRLRPFLVMETGNLLGCDEKQLLNVACAIECIHCYSLVHDDLPAMDDDDLRRGKPTLHKVHDEAVAILAGDALLTMAFDIMSDPATHEDAEIRIALIGAMARSAGIGGMVGGQILDLYPPNSEPTLDQIAQMQAMKTGALIRFSCEAGAICANASGNDLGALSEYGTYLGQAFQLADDILDETANQEQLGKQTGKDADKGKRTQVSEYGLEKALALANELKDKAIACLDEFGPEADILRSAAQFTIARTH